MNPLSHPIYTQLPTRTKAKLLSPVSEDKLTWDCFYNLWRAGVLAHTIAPLLNIEGTSLSESQLVMWGWEVDGGNTVDNPAVSVSQRPKMAAEYSLLVSILDELENYHDGKPEGQKTEPDVIVITKEVVFILECKRHHGLGGCSRFEDRRCPEIHVERRKRSYCQYWERGLASLVAFPRPTPSVEEPRCDQLYQLLRNYMIGSELAKRLGRAFFPLVVKNRNSPCYGQTEADVAAFNATIDRAPYFRIVEWSGLRDEACHLGVQVLEAYQRELG